MTASSQTIRCSNCSTLNFFTSQLCENCKMPLADERNAFRAAQGAPEPAPVPQAAPVGMGPRPVVMHPGYLSEQPRADGDDPKGLPEDAVVLRPNPFFGPIRRRTTTYRLSRLAIEVKSGLMHTRLDRVETYRIGVRSGDLDMTASFVQKFIKHTADIIIHTDDPDTPRIVLRDLSDAEMWKDRIGHAAKTEQLSRSPWNMGGGGPGG